MAQLHVDIWRRRPFGRPTWVYASHLGGRQSSWSSNAERQLWGLCGGRRRHQPAIAVDNKLKDQAAILTSLSTRRASRLDACADLANPTVCPYRCPLRSHQALSRHCQLLEARPGLRAALFAAKAANTQQAPFGGEELPPRTSKLPLFAMDHMTFIRPAVVSAPPSVPLSAHSRSVKNLPRHSFIRWVFLRLGLLHEASVRGSRRAVRSAACPS